MRPGTGSQRPGSKRVGTGVALSGQGMSLNKDLEVAARPMMREGMKGMTSSGVPGTSYGPARQIIDASYVIGQLRAKNAELTAEIERLVGVENDMVRGESTLGQLQQKQKTISDQLTLLKGTLNDVNFAVERANTQDAEGIHQQAMQLREANAQQRKLVDKTFLRVKETDSQTRQLVAQLEQESNLLEQKIASSGNGDVHQYLAVRGEAYAISDKVLTTQQEILSLVARKEALMATVAQDTDKKRATAVMLEILRKRALRDAMAKECAISVEQERAQLLATAKAHSSDMEVLERQISEGRTTLQESKSRLATAEEEASEYSGDNMRKYQELQQKDREMQEFIDSFPEKEMEEIRKTKEVEAAIVEALERIGRAGTVKEEMTRQNTRHVMEQISAELDEKEAHLKNAKVTYERLEKEVAERKEELQKIATLDDKITAELAAISNKMQERKQEIEHYGDIDGLRTDIENRKKALIARKGFLLKQRDCGKQRVHQLSMDMDGKKKKLAEDDVQTSLSALEQKLRLIWQSAYSLEEFVRIKEKDTQYLNIKADCLRVADEINNILKNPKRFEAPAVTIVQ